MTRGAGPAEGLITHNDNKYFFVVDKKKSKNQNFLIFQKFILFSFFFFLNDVKIFFVRIFFNDLDCVSRVTENYLGHSTVISERDIDRVYGGKPEKNSPDCLRTE